MSPPEPAISFSELFAYTDYLANRWFAYLTEHEAALALNLGGQTGTLRNLVEHIVQVEEFFASRLLVQEPAEKPENSGLADLLRMHKDAKEKFETSLMPVTTISCVTCRCLEAESSRIGTSKARTPSRKKRRSMRTAAAWRCIDTHWNSDSFHTISEDEVLRFPGKPTWRTSMATCAQ
jgi:hypothetical protein